ncbi:uncharacterized protein LOC132205503 [Neocloeon triangulifer]|uniref:uncharacterized protein LOC132205503 n=1 Tax=Neocloeon triangulifer TaxID=2078957 RepID=UPI00286F6DAE|nr:uncharacterized protein LOC132205503 [Neocloeon triangulifer]XP_059490582.1 uncharacterized protein LOC132205503 [Neocloeon triangulifer]
MDAMEQLEQLMEVIMEQFFEVGCKRSIMRNLRPLKELSLMTIRNSASVKTSAVPYQHLSPSLRLDILKYLESQGECDKLLSQEMRLWIFELLNRLLDASIKEFDFIVFSQCKTSDYPRDCQVWEMLIERCPNLVRVADSRKVAILTRDEDGAIVRSLYDQSIEQINLFIFQYVPFLLKFPKLMHIELGWYIMDENSMATIAETFPNLQTLCFAIDFVTFNLLKSLFTLQKLEILKINWDHYSSSTNESLELKQFEQSRMMFECLIHLPLLRICCSDNTDDTIRHGVLKFCSGGGTLNLETLRTKGFFDFKLVPSLVNLRIDEPLFFKSFSSLDCLHHLRVLHLHKVVSFVNLSEVLSDCGSRLEELTINSCPERTVNVDPFVLFSLCPRLKKLSLLLVNLDLSEVEKSSALVNESHFSRMESFQFISVFSTFPSELIFHILLAPNLKYFHVNNLNIISSISFAHLLVKLVHGHALQKLKTFEFGCQVEGPYNSLIVFLSLLPVYAPRLALLKCCSAEAELKTKLLNSLLTITIPDFLFECPP